MEIHCAKPQIRDHPNKVPTSKDFKESADFSTSSKMRVLRSLQISHTKQAGTIFQTEEDCNPRKFSHANRRETIVLGITRCKPNIKNTSLHKTCANLLLLMLYLVFLYLFLFPPLRSVHTFLLVHQSLSSEYDQTFSSDSPSSFHQQGYKYFKLISSF